MTEHDHWPMLYLAPSASRTAAHAGVSFARSLAGCPSAWFMVALSEQGGVVRDGIRKAGFPKRQARLTASTFEDAARAEWQRIASTTQAEMWGTA